MQSSTTTPRALVASAIFAGFIAFLYVLSGLMLLLLGVTSAASAVVAGAGVALVALGSAMLSAVYGLMARREWGRRLMTWLSALSVLISLSFIYPGWPGRSNEALDAALQGLIAALFVAVAAYLSRPGIRALYARAT